MKKQDTKQLIDLTITFVQTHILKMASENEGERKEAIKYGVYEDLIAQAISSITNMGFVETRELLLEAFKKEETNND